MLVFCHLLINRDSDRGLEESLRPIESSGSSREQSYLEGLLCFCLTDFPLFAKPTVCLTSRPNEQSVPIFFVFLHVLMSGSFNYLFFFSLISGIVRERRVARFSQKAANRWLLAVMLLRNPSLRRCRRQGGVTCFVDMTSTSINSVVEILA